MTSLAERTIAERRARVVEVTDARGRTIRVRRLPPSEHVRVLGLSHRDEDPAPLLCAAAVISIQGSGTTRTITSPAGEHVLWSVVGLLGEDGIAAVTHALWLHMADGGRQPSPPNPFRCFDTNRVPVSPSAIDRAATILPPPPPPQPFRPAFVLDAIRPLFHKP